MARHEGLELPGHASCRTRNRVVYIQNFLASRIHVQLGPTRFKGSKTNSLMRWLKNVYKEKVETGCFMHHRFRIEMSEYRVSSPYANEILPLTTQPPRARGQLVSMDLSM